jgi:membrane protein DedA with SNARE-associated domain
MPEEVVSYIWQYGYLAIFLFVFLQETGAPNPIPNEFLLLFSGYLIFSGTLNALGVIFAAATGDLLAASVVYTLFYYFGQMMIHSKTRWLSGFARSLQGRVKKLAPERLNGIILVRLTPFIRGYSAAACGLVRIQLRKYSLAVIVSTFIWCPAYVACGYLLGPYWAYVDENIVSFKYLLAAFLLLFIIQALLRIFLKKKQNKTSLENCYCKDSELNIQSNTSNKLKL